MSTSKFAVLGSPIAHSKSPLLHSAAYQFLGLEGSYDRIEVKKGKLQEFLQNEGTEFDGFSITAPLKAEAYELSSEHDVISSRISTANTIIPHGEKWFACNTDVLGFMEILKRNFTSSLEHPLILGSGSTAKSALYALTQFGVNSIQLMARNASAVEEIVNLFPDVEIIFLPWATSVANASLVISAVAEVRSISFDKRVSNFVDVSYDESSLMLALITANSYTYLNGLHLLVYQAAHQVLQMRNIDAAHYENIVEAMFSALELPN